MYAKRSAAWGRCLAVALLTLAASAVAALATPSEAAGGGRRVALVIGNGAYEHATTLPNPVKDARLISRTLKDSGFEVIEGFDADKARLETLVDRFTEAAYGADIGLIYYAGHGLQVDGKNYIIPVDAELTSPAHLRTRAIEIEDLLSTLPPDPAVGVVILDACRDNPLGRTLATASGGTRAVATGGLAPVQMSDSGDGTGGVLIAYATDPGAVALDGKGENSPYTAALAKYITTPGLELQSALTRVRGEVAEETDGKQRPWHNASLGREIFLGSAPAEEKQAETIPSPISTPLDGAQMRWEEEQRFWDEVSKRDSLAFYEAYLARYPDGHFAALARLSVEQARAPVETARLEPAIEVEPNSQSRMGTAIPPEVRVESGSAETEAALGLGKPERIDLQLRLGAAGFAVGGVDGDIGPNSRAAIRGWQESHRLEETGYLTAEQYALLREETEVSVVAARADYETRLRAEAQRRENARRAAQADQERNRAAVVQTQPPRIQPPQTTGEEYLRMTVDTIGQLCRLTGKC